MGFGRGTIKTRVYYYRGSILRSHVYSVEPKTEAVKTLGVIGRNESGLAFKGQKVFTKPPPSLTKRGGGFG